MQRVIKRDGREVEFDKAKIIKAISQANQEIIKSKQIGPRKINQLASIVEEKCSEYKRAIKVEDINDLIEDELIFRNYNELVRAFIKYPVNDSDLPGVEQLSYEARYNASTGLNCNDERLIKAVAYQCAALLCNVYEKYDAANVFQGVASALCNNSK